VLFCTLSRLKIDRNRAKKPHNPRPFSFFDYFATPFATPPLRSRFGGKH
jgi:hypothetical protein